jgi:hypothetical protein
VWRRAASRGRAHTIVQSSTRELPLAIVTLTLRRKVLRLLLTGVPARATSRLLLLTQPVEIRLDNGRVEFKPDSTEVVEGNGDKCTVGGGFIVATGASYFLCLFTSALDVVANGEGLALRERFPARVGVRYLAAIVATTVRSTPTLASLLPGQRATKSSSLSSRVPGMRKKAGRTFNSNPICA